MRRVELSNRILGRADVGRSPCIRGSRSNAAPWQVDSRRCGVQGGIGPRHRTGGSSRGRSPQTRGSRTREPVNPRNRGEHTELAARTNSSRSPAAQCASPSRGTGPAAVDPRPSGATRQTARLPLRRSIPAHAGVKAGHRRLNQKADEVVRTAIERLFPADGRSPGRSPYVRGPRPNPANSSEALDPRTPGAKTLFAVSAYSTDDPRRRGVGPTQTDPRTQPGQPPETGARHHSEKTAESPNTRGTRRERRFDAKDWTIAEDRRTQPRPVNTRSRPTPPSQPVNNPPPKPPLSGRFRSRP